MMITRHEGGHGSFAKQFLKEGSMKVSYHHSQQAYCSGENLSPRSVLEQRALSGLAIAIDLEEKMKLSLTQENAILGRYLSKQSIMQMSAQEAQAQGNFTVEKAPSRERMNYLNPHERGAGRGESSVGLKMVISMRQMSNDEKGEVQERFLVGRSSVGGERKHDNVKSLLPSACRTSIQRGQSTSWLHQLGHVRPSFPACVAATEDSIFHYASSNPPSSASHQHPVDHRCQAFSPVKDFLRCCFFCKCGLGAGKDIYMYRGDQAFCSVECRHEQIVKDERISASAL